MTSVSGIASPQRLFVQPSSDSVDLNAILDDALNGRSLQPLASNSREETFLELEDPVRKELAKVAMSQFGQEGIDPTAFADHYRAVLADMVGQTTELDKTAEKIKTYLNERAEEISAGDIHCQSVHQSVVNLLRPLGRIAFICSLAAGGVTYYYRSQKVFAVASGCTACALMVLSSACFKSIQTFVNIDRDYADASELNLPQKLNEYYEQLQKTSYLMGIYLNAHPKIKNPNKGPILLQEQLSAVFHLRSLARKLLYRSKVPAISDAYQIDERQMVKFFENFEALCRKTAERTFGVGALALGWTYYAYSQKSYPMMVAGIVHFLGAICIFNELSIFQKGSKSIYTQGNVVERFKEMASSSLLLRRLRFEEATELGIYKAIIWPLDAIFKLIPSWVSMKHVPLSGTSLDDSFSNDT